MIYWDSVMYAIAAKMSQIDPQTGGLFLRTMQLKTARITTIQRKTLRDIVDKVTHGLPETPEDIWQLAYRVAIVSDNRGFINVLARKLAADPTTEELFKLEYNLKAGHYFHSILRSTNVEFTAPIWLPTNHDILHQASEIAKRYIKKE